MSFKEYLNVDTHLLPRAVAGFGGGFGLKGSLCGVFLASVMAIGLKYGRNDMKDAEALARTNDKVKKYLGKFVLEFGSMDCYELAGYHLETPGQFQAWVASGGVKRCNAMLRRNIQIVIDEFLV